MKTWQVLAGMARSYPEELGQLARGIYRGAQVQVQVEKAVVFGSIRCCQSKCRLAMAAGGLQALGRGL